MDYRVYRLFEIILNVYDLMFYWFFYIFFRYFWVDDKIIVVSIIFVLYGLFFKKFLFLVCLNI